MEAHDVLSIVNETLPDFGKFSLPVCAVSKPTSINEAINLCKIVSKLSPVVSNLIEYRMMDFFNEIPELKDMGTWRRQDPGFPDTIFDSKISPRPGIEIKSWFPLATEMTARFRDSQKFFTQDQTFVLIVCWLPEFVIYGNPVVIGTSFISGKSIAEIRDRHYFNPPNYLILEPENTADRTINLQQTNTNGYKFQDSPLSLKKAEDFARKNKILNADYSLDENFQSRLRELFSKFKYRLDTNYAKIDRIQHPAIEDFKTNILKHLFCGKTVFEWSKIISNPEKPENQNILRQQLGIK